jgi:hypothetical protein
MDGMALWKVHMEGTDDGRGEIGIFHTWVQASTRGSFLASGIGQDSLRDLKRYLDSGFVHIETEGKTMNVLSFWSRYGIIPHG